MPANTRPLRLISALLVLSACAGPAFAVILGTGVTYQGFLRDGVAPYDGNASMTFRLFTAAVGGAQVGVDDPFAAVQVENGLFTVTINDSNEFGASAFTGDARWLEIVVNGNTLSPRQPLTVAPFATFAVAANRLHASDGNPLNVVSVDSAGDVSVTGSVLLTNDLDSIIFPATAAPNNPMISMFASGTTNADRMVIAHSPSFAEYGLLYSDASDTFFFQASNVGTATMTIGLGGNVGINNESPALPLDVSGAARATGDIRGARFVDNDNTTFFLDPSSTGFSIDIAGSVMVATGEGLQIGAAGLTTAAGAWTIGGNDIRLRLGDTSADQVSSPAKEIFMSDTVTPADGDQRLLFTDGADIDANFIMWDDATTYACGGTIGDIDSAFVFHITDNVAAGWVFTSGTTQADAEVKFDEFGNFQADGTIVSSNSCDLAESFLGADDLLPGTVLVLDPARSEGVLGSTSAYQDGIVGVVTTAPAFLMSGPTADAYPLIQQLHDAEAAAAMSSTEKALMEEMVALDAGSESSDDRAVATRKAEIMDSLRREWARSAPAEQAVTELEQQFDNWTRGNVNVALVGRVPVRVIGTVQPGDHLTTSNVPGVAMAMNAPGATVGVALSAFDGAGEGTVVALIQPGWYGGVAALPAGAAVTGDVQSLQAENQELRARLSVLEEQVARLMVTLEARE